MGPMAGPNTCVSWYTAMPLPRSSGRQQSVSTPLPIPTLALPPSPARKRKAVIWDWDVAAPHSAVNRMNTIFPKRMTGTLPQTSEHGDRIKGPIAYASRKIDRTSCSSAPNGMRRSFPMDESAGAVIDEQSGERKAKLETINDVYLDKISRSAPDLRSQRHGPGTGRTQTAHFRPLLQFLGFCGSSGPSQPT